MLTIQSVILGTQLLNGYGLCSAGDRRYTAVGPSLANAAFIAICLVRAICREFACLLFCGAPAPQKKAHKGWRLKAQAWLYGLQRRMRVLTATELAIAITFIVVYYVVLVVFLYHLISNVVLFIGSLLF